MLLSMGAVPVEDILQVGGEMFVSLAVLVMKWSFVKQEEKFGSIGGLRGIYTPRYSSLIPPWVRRTGQALEHCP